MINDLLSQNQHNNPLQTHKQPIGLYSNLFIEDGKTYWVRLNNSQQYGLLAAPERHRNLFFFYERLMFNKNFKQNKQYCDSGKSGNISLLFEPVIVVFETSWWTAAGGTLCPSDAPGSPVFSPQCRV